jgi:hypothetical protein
VVPELDLHGAVDGEKALVRVLVGGPQELAGQLHDLDLIVVELRPRHAVTHAPRDTPESPRG